MTNAAVLITIISRGTERVLPGVIVRSLGASKQDQSTEREVDVKFMGTWQIHEGKIQQAYDAFSKMTPEQDAADRGKAIKLIGRWHDMAGGRGVLICETDSAEALEKWSLNWNGILNSAWVPVVDDNEARELYKSRGK